MKLMFCPNKQFAGYKVEGFMHVHRRVSESQLHPDDREYVPIGLVPIQTHVATANKEVISEEIRDIFHREYAIAELDHFDLTPMVSTPVFCLHGGNIVEVVGEPTTLVVQHDALRAWTDFFESPDDVRKGISTGIAHYLKPKRGDVVDDFKVRLTGRFSDPEELSARLQVLLSQCESGKISTEFPESFYQNALYIMDHDEWTPEVFPDARTVGSYKELQDMKNEEGLAL